jgi:hypothetical protein
MSSSTINGNLCTDQLVNEINERILARTMTSGNIEVLISPRPQSTLYTRPLNNSIPPGPPCKPRVLKYNSDPKKNFLPCTKGGSWSQYNQNIDKESILRNQIYALQNAPQAKYVPNSTSDLYNSTIPKSQTSTAQGLYPNLPTSNAEYNIWGLQPTLNREAGYQFLQPPVNLGNKLFNNDTRQEIKDK